MTKIKAVLIKKIKIRSHFIYRRLRLKLARGQRFNLFFRSSLAALFIVPFMAMAYLYVSTRPNYALTKKASVLVGQADQKLASKVTFNGQMYTLNQKSIQTSAAPNVQIGSSNKDPQAYSASIPTDLTKGIKIYDDKAKLSFSMTPEFTAAVGKDLNNHFVYPIVGGSNQAIYTIKSDGVKEDIVINKPSGNGLSFSYKLNLPNDLAAKTMSDGGVGIYSANPALFGNISYGTQADKQKVQEARQKSPKNHLVFELLPPIVKETNGQSNGQTAGKAMFKLSGNTLKVEATGLAKLHYPISIDPSVLVNSAINFNTANNEGGVKLNNSSVTEAGLTGGGISSVWSASGSLTSGFNSNSGAQGGAAVTYNGYLYEIGGTSGNNTNPNYSVDYAQLNSNGSIGSWTATNSISSSYGYKGIAGVAYDGYLYVMGGGDGNLANPSNNIQYAPICTGSNVINGCTTSSSPGSIGNWTVNASNFSGARTFFGAAAYDGYMYIAGGVYCTSGLGCTYTYYNDTQYAKINSDGSIGAWTTSSHTLGASMPVSMTVYNGYLYAIDSCQAGTCSNGVIFTKIQSNGDIGGWVSTSSYQGSAGSLNSIIAYNGYVYLTPGFVGGSDSTQVQYAPIYSEGTIGNWHVAPSTLNLAVSNYMFAAYNNYLYVVGGYSHSSIRESAETQYASIDPAGYLGAATDISSGTGALNTAVYGVSSVAYNGYIYAIGGYNGSSSITTVEYSQIQSNGAPGAWTQISSGTGALVQAIAYGGVTAYNGYLYLVGGYGTAQVKAVEYSQIQSNGAPGAWTRFASGTTGALLTGSYYLGVTAYNGYLYAIGGYNGTRYLDDVQYSQIQSNGAPGAWTDISSGTGALQTSTDGESVVENGSFIYAIGGYNGTSELVNVEYSQIQSNGAPGAWTQITSGVGSLQTATAYASAAESNGYIYLMGGYDGSYLTTIEYAPIQSNGAPGSWSTTNGLTTATGFLGGAVYNGNLYAVGGYTGSATAAVEYFSINNGGGGAISSWANNYGLTYATYRASSVIYNGYIYEIGGLSGGSPTSYVYYNSISSTGQLASSTWQTNPTILPTATSLNSAVAYGGYVYVLGGLSTTGGIANVYYALICTGANMGQGCTTSSTAGTLGTWNSATNLSPANEWATAVAYNGYIYEIGGCAGTSSCSATANVYYAPINSNGSIGSWSLSTSLPTADYTASAVINNGYIYEIGGYDGSSYLSNVYYAPINSNGTLGAWSSTASLPMANISGSANIYNGFIYYLGGANSSGSSVNTVYYASINTNGTISDWQTANSITTPVESATSVIGNGWIYEIGGYNTSTSAAITNVYYAGLYTISHTGAFSMPVNIGQGVNVTPAAIVSYGSDSGNPGEGGGEGGISVQDSYATSSCSTYGSVSLAEGGELGLAYNVSMTTDGCGSSTAVGEYAFVFYELDDSDTATFPDLYSNHTSVTSFQIFYHPYSGMRLRGGETFSSGSLQSLDATP